MSLKSLNKSLGRVAIPSFAPVNNATFTAPKS